jgi:hypothetical protein
VPADARFTAVLFVTFLLASSPAEGQSAQQVWVVDPSGAAIPGAEVVVLADGTLVSELSASEFGVVTLPAMPRATIRLVVTAPGFATVEHDVRPVRAGSAAPIVITLPLAIVEDSVTVAGGALEAGGATTTLSASELALLPEDDEALMQMLEDLAGPGSEVRVDGFSGDRLPDREQILRITIRRDAYSAEFEQPGRGRVDILTRPAAERWRTSASYTVRPSSWSANNAMARSAPQGTRQRFNGSLAGPLVRNRAAIFLEGSLGRSEDSRAISAILPTGPYVTAVQQPGRDVRLTARVESMLGRSTLARLSWSGEASTRENQGLSELDLPERGYEREALEQNLRLSIDGGPRKPYYVRVSYDVERSEVVPDVVAPTLVVNNAFRSGGASVSGEDRTDELELETAWTLVAQPFTLRTGAELAWVRDDQGVLNNVLGTFTFSTMASYEAQVPANYSRRLGARPLVLDTFQVAPFVQADIRLQSGWAIGIGARYQAQTNLDDASALSPRIGVTRSFNRNRSAIRAGFGSYHGWLPAGVWEENVRLGGSSTEREIIIRNPGYPDPESAGEEQLQLDPPTSVTIAPRAHLTRWTRTSFGINHQLAGGIRLNADVYRLWTTGDWRAIDLNAPEAGLRPNPDFGRTLIVNSTGRLTDWGFGTDVNYSNQRLRIFANVRYSFARRWSDADDPLAPPPDGRTFETEWGPSRGDPGHRVSWTLGGPIRWGIEGSVSGRFAQGNRYNVTTGLDVNGDAYFNERPEGVLRYARRGDLQAGTDLRLSWRPSLTRQGERGFGAQRGPQGGQGGGQGGRQGGGRRNEPNVELYLSVSNLFNRVNYTSFVGNLTSDLFGQPTSAAAARRVETGLRFRF